MNKKGICLKCLQVKELTHHSLICRHIPPFIQLCDECHKIIHSVSNWHYTKWNQTILKMIR